MNKEYIPVPLDLAKTILERDEFTCSECGQQVPKVLLFIDKILSPESADALGDMPEEDKYTCLCEECYKRAHGHLQFKPASRTAERRRQLEMLVQWRREKKGLESDTNAYLIDYINGKIEPFSLTKQGAQNVRKAIRKTNFTTALDAIDETFDLYITYDNGEDINKDSVDDFINKIGGYLYINSLPPVDREMYHILYSCRSRFAYWDQNKAKGYVLDYIDALREQGWSEDRILADLKTELLRASYEQRNWSQWTDLVIRWTAEIRSWSKPKPNIQSNDNRLRYEGETLTETLDLDIDFANESLQVIKLFYDHFAGSTPEGWNALSSYIEDALLRFLLDMREQFRQLKGIPLAKKDILNGYIDMRELYNLIHTYPIDEEYGYHSSPEARPSDFSGAVQHHFLANGCNDLIREIFWYFDLPSRRLDYQSDLEALDYYIKHYRRTFIIPGK